MASFGKTSEFNPDNECWTAYTERLEEYFTANDIDDDANRQRAILLSVVGPKTYNLIRNLVSPRKPKEHTFTELVKLVQDHHNPRPSPIVERFKFNSCYRQTGQSVRNYVAELRRISEHCEYGAELDNMLRDRIVCGINDDRIQRRLLSESGLTYKKSLELAEGIETASKNITDMQSVQSNRKGESATVNKISHSNKLKGQRNDKSSKKSYSTPEKPPDTTHQKSNKCYRCGDNTHTPDKCRFKETVCLYCHIKGHIVKVCRRKKAHSTNMIETENDDDMSEYLLFHVDDGDKEMDSPITTKVLIDCKPVEMQIDCGASRSLISESTLRHMYTHTDVPTLKPASINLRSYSGQKIDILGNLDVTVEHRGQKVSASVPVVAGSKPNLFGRDWARMFHLDWENVFHIAGSDTVNDILIKHASVFQEGSGEIQGVYGTIYMDPSAEPKFYKPRPVPYAMKEKVENELDRLLKEGIIEPVQFSEWATPIVPVLKSDNTVRICGDYKITVNLFARLDQYPIPRIEDLYASLSGGEVFTKIDLKCAYHQLPLDEKSKVYTTINTHRGLFRYNRLPFGISSASAIFQRCIDNLMQGIPMSCGYQDDILTSGRNNAQHAENLNSVLTKLSDAGVRVQKDKCTFQAKEVTYLGHRIDSEGLHPVLDKVEAIRDAPAPTNVSELKSYLGLLNYYGKFLPNLSTLLAPLHMLLRKDVNWKWGQQQERAFVESKKLLQSSQLLVHYDPSKDLILASDASNYGIGAVLSHKMHDGSEKPVAFASRTLNSAEQKYSQIEKEGLSVIFAVKKFNSYLFGRHFYINNDHKPLQTLFGEAKGVPSMASARIQRWALTLSAYSYTFRYKPGKDIGHADAMSRLPLPVKPNSVPTPPETVFLLDFMDTSPVSAAEIETWTRKDPVLSRVHRSITSGWNLTKDPKFQPFITRKDELSTQGDVILWGSRVVIPQPGRSRILDMLHDSHPGIVRMKAMARTYVWWPNMDSEIEAKVRECDSCQVNAKATPSTHMHPWKYPQGPWTRIHVDYAGPFMDKMFLIIVDAFSKWVDVHVMTTSTSAATIEKMQSTFATHGLPKTVVSDNGTCFTSYEFQKFMSDNGIEHVFSPPYHPGSNGLAERTVQTLKEGLKKMSGGTIQSKVSRFLFRYRTMPHSTTGKTPAELMMGRKLRTHFDLLHPDNEKKVHAAQKKQKDHHDNHSKQKTLSVGDNVYATNFGRGPRWMPGIIVAQTSSMCNIKTLNGQIVRRHLDHVKSRYNDKKPESVIPDVVPDIIPETVVSTQNSVSSPTPGTPSTPTHSKETSTKTPVKTPQKPDIPVRRSSRISKAPDRLDL